MFRDLGDRGDEAWALNHYAALPAAAGDRPRALVLYRQALAVHQELNKRDDEALSLEGICECLVTADGSDEGTRYLRQALEIFQLLGMRTDAGRVENRLADLALRHPSRPATVAKAPSVGSESGHHELTTAE